MQQLCQRSSREILTLNSLPAPSQQILQHTTSCETQINNFYGQFLWANNTVKTWAWTHFEVFFFLLSQKSTPEVIDPKDSKHTHTHTQKNTQIHASSVVCKWSLLWFDFQQVTWSVTTAILRISPTTSFFSSGFCACLWVSMCVHVFVYVCEVPPARACARTHTHTHTHTQKAKQRTPHNKTNSNSRCVSDHTGCHLLSQLYTFTHSLS